jgi:hypothetical protein
MNSELTIEALDDVIGGGETLGDAVMNGIKQGFTENGGYWYNSANLQTKFQSGGNTVTLPRSLN